MDHANNVNKECRSHALGFVSAVRDKVKFSARSIFCQMNDFTTVTTAKYYNDRLDLVESS